MKNIIKQDKSGLDIRLIMVLPFGLEESIYPWGVRLIRDYLSSNCNPLALDVWDCRGDMFFGDVNIRFGSLLSKLFLGLAQGHKDTFFGAASNPDIFLGVAACVGKEFHKFTGERRWRRDPVQGELQALQDEVQGYITSKIAQYTCCGEEQDVAHIWAFSVYDRTLFNSLYMARLIKAHDPKAEIILGGDYFNFQNARITVESIPFIDGVAVGYGEEIMRRLVMGRRQHIPLKDQRIQGLVNRNNHTEQQPPLVLKEVNIPQLYQQWTVTGGHSPFVQHTTPGEIRILAQRGCSWGRCTFCTQFDRNLCFQVPVEHLINSVKTIIQNVKYRLRGNPLKIHFDADENDPGMFIAFVKYLESIAERGLRFEIDLWFQVKKFRKEMAEMLAGIDHKKIHVRFMLNFESLNPETLVNMRKGHSPIQAIEAAKAIQDSGHSFVSNYLTHYPLETRNNVSKEIRLLENTVHLFMPPKGRINLFPYGASNRDAVNEDPTKFKIKTRRIATDTWLKDVFGLPLPFSLWALTYDEKPAFTLDRLLIHSYYKTIKARAAVYQHRWIAGINWGNAAISLRDRIGLFYRLSLFLGWEAVHRFIQLFKGGGVYGKRTRLFVYLSKQMGVAAVESIKPAFYLSDGCLYKRSRVPDVKNNWPLPLNDGEQKILRYLYWSRKHEDVIRRFKDEITEPDIDRTITRHLELGSLLRFKNRLLCVVNDPGYWNVS